MARTIVDERTLAAYLISPTEQRARDLELTGKTSLIRYADIEEHVRDPDSGVTLRCDLTLRSRREPLVSAELKRPEVMAADAYALKADAYKKAVGRGMSYFITCNMVEVFLWRTTDGPHSPKYVLKHVLAEGLSESYYAPPRRDEIATNWQTFLDDLEAVIAPVTLDARNTKTALPPHVMDLRKRIVDTGKEVGERLQLKCHDDVFRDKVLRLFRDQFGVELQLDPAGPPENFLQETEQVGSISAFVVASRLLLYQALSMANLPDGRSFNLDKLEITATTTDPGRVGREIAGLLEHARRRTGDFETTLTPTDIDELVFVDSGEPVPVGQKWSLLLETIRRHDWTGPSDYVPGLYESLLDDEHRHLTGVHYTPEPVAELVTTFAVREPADIVLDPASGGGTFLAMAYARKRELGSNHVQALSETYGIEIAEFAASLSTLVLAIADPTADSAYPREVVSDFFKIRPGEVTPLTLPEIGSLVAPQKVDAVIGNPPYVRFELREEPEKQRILEALQSAVATSHTTFPDFTGKADLWAFFVAHSHSFLSVGGRLAFVLPWNLLSSAYGDAVLAFLSRYFHVDAIIESKVERWFAAKQNTILLFATRVEQPINTHLNTYNTNIPDGHLVRFVRLKQPLDTLLDSTAPKGKRAEDLLDDLFAVSEDADQDVRWDIRVVRQRDLVEGTHAYEGGEQS